MKIACNPDARFDIEVSELELRRTERGRTLMARLYAPKGMGPFPVLLDLHGGAWNNKDRTANETMDRAVAASGVLVAAIDMTLAPEAPYPASVQDANYGIRWLKSKAAAWKGDPATLGLLGSSTGGHIAELIALRPRDARYNAIALAGAPGVDAAVAYVATRSPISDPYARFQQAERREKAALPPLLIMQGALDDNVLPALQEKFAASYRAAGGECRFEIFEGCEHLWIDTSGPQTDRAHAMVKAFIARNLAKMGSEPRVLSSAPRY